MFALQPQLHRIEGEHPVDREVPSHVAQERDVGQAVEPVGVVGHQRRRRPGRAVEIQVVGEGPADPGDVGVDRVFGQQLAALVLARRVADLGRAAAHQGDRPVAGLLHPAQQHDLHQVPDMQRIRRRIEADIAGDRPLGRQGVQRLEVGALVDIAARVEQAQQVGLEPAGHGGSGSAGGR